MASNATENHSSDNSLSNSCAETSVVIEPQELRIKTKLKLIINKFCEIGNDHILSPIFNIGLNTKWYFKIKTNHTDNRDKDVEHLSIHLFLCYCEELSVRAKYTVSIVDVNNDLKNTKTCDELEYKISGDGWGYQKYCDKKYLIDRFGELLPNNRLTLLCEIEVIGEQNNCIEDNFLVEFKKIRSTFKMLSDFTFIVSGKEFPVHKTILAVRSPVFAAMFTKNKKNSGDECIDKLVISDIESNVFREMLSFIYTGKATQMANMAQKLLPLTQNYNIIQLKSICEDILYEELCETNAIKTIILAQKCNANKLRDRIIDYIADNLLLVRNGSAPEEWKHFIEEYPMAVDKVFEAISYKTQKNTDKKLFHINRWIFRKFNRNQLK